MADVLIVILPLSSKIYRLTSQEIIINILNDQ